VELERLRVSTGLGGTSPRRGARSSSQARYERRLNAGIVARDDQAVPPPAVERTMLDGVAVAGSS
jgi:hypothetical protein